MLRSRSNPATRALPILARSTVNVMLDRRLLALKQSFLTETKQIAVKWTVKRGSSEISQGDTHSNATTGMIRTSILRHSAASAFLSTATSGRP